MATMRRLDWEMRAVRRGQRRSFAGDPLAGGGTQLDRQVGKKIAEGAGLGISDEQLGRREAARRFARFDRLHREAGIGQQLAHLRLVNTMGQPAGRPRVGVEGRPCQYREHQFLKARAWALGAAADAEPSAGLQNARKFAQRSGLFRQPVKHRVEADDVEIGGRDG